ncbi:hypothetical protein EZS27_024287 [termite gut metagenome]|uniref:Uncharacterized protein n=1 Tax=termite gut metagenome TaxID=433724 RepID=A0A5J4QZG1_9ZZZZ
MIHAPVLLFVYNRPAHVVQAVASLQQNKLAAQSPLFIYSDAAKDEESRLSVEETRKFIRTVTGFESVTECLRTGIIDIGIFR